MHWVILGPVGASAGGRQVDLGRPKQRAVLAQLLVHANRVVALDRLIDAMLGDAPPARATATLQGFISNLRRSLEPHRAPRAPARILLTHPPGHLLSLAPGDVHAARFEAALCPERLPEVIESAVTAVAVARRQGAYALEAQATFTLTARTRL